MDVRDWIHKAPGFMFQQVLTFVLPLSSCSAYVTAFHNHRSRNLVQGGVVQGGDADLERRRGFLRIHCFIAWGEWLAYPPSSEAVSDSENQHSTGDIGFLISKGRLKMKGTTKMFAAELMELFWSVCSLCDGSSRQKQPCKKTWLLQWIGILLLPFLVTMGKYLVCVTIVQGSEGNAVSCQICSCGTSTKWKSWLFFFRTWSFSKSWRGCGITWHRYFTAKFFSSRQEYDECQEWPMAGHYSHAYFVKQQSGEIIAAWSSFGWPKLT